MSSEWSRVKVEDVCELIVDCVNKTAPVVDYRTPYRMIRTTHIKNGKISLTDEKFVTRETYEKWIRRAKLEIGDVLLTREAPLGSVAMIREQDTLFLGQRIVQYRANIEVLDSGFLLYSFLSPDLQTQFHSFGGTGSTVDHIRVPDCVRFEITLPPLKEQKAIAHILGTLDDKIELNRKTNETLEAMAKALFKSWFVDFDPVRAKGEGRPTGLPAEISDLFPDSFEDSELGEIPSGWSVRRLRDFIQLVKDRQGDRNIEEYSATVTGIEPRDSRFKMNLSRSGDKNKVALEGDLVFGLSRRTINFGRMAQPIGAFSSVYEVFRSTSGSTISTKIIEQCIRSRMNEFMVILKPAAREGQATDREVLLEQLIADFPEQVNTQLEILLEPVSKRIELTSEHMFALEQLRDALLPKLISGEIRIPDAERMLEEVGI